jgi:hypothetical protein
MRKRKYKSTRMPKDTDKRYLSLRCASFLLLGRASKAGAAVVDRNLSEQGFGSVSLYLNLPAVKEESTFD